MFKTGKKWFAPVWLYSSNLHFTFYALIIREKGIGACGARGAMQHPDFSAMTFRSLRPESKYDAAPTGANLSDPDGATLSTKQGSGGSENEIAARISRHCASA